MRVGNLHGLSRIAPRSRQNEFYWRYHTHSTGAGGLQLHWTDLMVKVGHHLHRYSI